MTEQQNLETLWNERQITKTILHFGRALDRGDWSGYAAAFTSQVNIDFERLTGFQEIRVSAEDWADFTSLILSPLKRHHTLSNIDITLEGQTAFATVYMTARHWKDLNIKRFLLSAKTRQEMNVQYGWYSMWLTETAGDWKICRMQNSWSEGGAPLIDRKNPDPVILGKAKALFSPANMASATEFLSTAPALISGR